MKRTFLLLALLLTGCDGGCNKIKKTVGLEVPPEDVQKQQDDERRAREEAQKRLKDADALVLSFTERVAQQTDPSGGFKHHEGLTESDPWGTNLKVDYRQEGTSEIVTVRSAGPDTRFDTQDDLVRTRMVSNFWGFHRGLSGLQWILAVWIASAVFGTLLYLLVGSQRVSHGKRRKHPVAGVFILCLLGPIALLFLAFSAVAGVLGEGVDFDLGDFDLPFGD
jgi:hypothetical protein